MEDEVGRKLGGRALVTGDGDMHFFVTATDNFASAPQFVVHGNVCCEGKADVELKWKRYLTDRENNARFKFDIKGDELSGDVRIRGEQYKFSLDRSSRYAETLTLADLAGTYTRTTIVFLASQTYTVTIDPSGQLNGSHTNGCVYTGTVAIADAPRNLARLDVQLSNCPSSITGSGSMNGRYTGLGFLARDTPSPNDSSRRTNVFIHSLVGPTWLGHQPVAK